VFLARPGGDFYNASNWSNGIPTETMAACFPSGTNSAAAGGATGNDLGFPLPEPGTVGFVGTASGTPHPLAIGACCLGSSCLITDYFDCLIQGGYFRENQVFCDDGICDTGACCTDTPACADDDGGGGPMDEKVCDIRGGEYLGGAVCDASDPCQRSRLPQGFEIVIVSIGSYNHGVPRMNNCGQVVFHRSTTTADLPEADVWLYDDSALVLWAEDPDVANSFPDISDTGMIAWTKGFNSSAAEIVVSQDIGEMSLGAGEVPSINNRGHIAWKRHVYPSCPDPRRDDIYFFDGVDTFLLFADDFSNQSVQLNDLDQTSWTNYHFSCGGGFGGWTSDILLRSGTNVSPLESVVDTPQLVAIDNMPRVAWSNFDLVEVWQSGVTVQFTDGHAPGLNDRGDIAYTFKSEVTPWELFLSSDGQLFYISNPCDVPESVDNIRPSINNQGEIAWWQHPNGEIVPSSIWYMRRIRNGDVNFDGVVDIDDFTAMPGCFTGPGEFDRLCECRFYDIDHDRDIDQDDFDLFMRVYAGPIEDCDGNSTIDFQDLIDGTHNDCNANGVPDQCDLGQARSIRAATVRERNETGRHQSNEATRISIATDPEPRALARVTVRERNEEGRRDREQNYELQITNDEKENRQALAIDNLQSQIDNSNDEIATPGAAAPRREESRRTGEQETNGDGRAGIAAAGESGLAMTDEAGSVDLDGDGVPDECCSGSAPALADVEGAKNRVLSIQIGQPRTIAPTNPLPPRPPQALRVTFVPGAGEQAWSMYVGPPKEVCENSGQGFNVNPADCVSVGNRPKTFTVATLRCEPYFTDWHEVGAVYVYHPAIAPEGQFVVQTINDGCGLSAESNYSAGLNLATGKFGDTVSSCATNPCGPPNAVIDAADVLAALDKFRNTPTSSRKFRVDLEPATLDGFINVSDITMVLNAFSGAAYPFETPTPSCP
jgi:hypothetical protein